MPSILQSYMAGGGVGCTRFQNGVVAVVLAWHCRLQEGLLALLTSCIDCVAHEKEAIEHSRSLDE